MILQMQITCMRKEFAKTLKKKNFDQYHDFYFKKGTLLLADLFENFRKISLKIYELDPAKSL